MTRACADCHRPARHHTRGLCRTCYRRRERAGTRDERPMLRAAKTTPPPMRKRDALARFEDYSLLRVSCGEVLETAAKRTGVSVRTAWRYEAHLRQGRAA